MPHEIWTHAVAGLLAGLGLAMPMGAITALLLREGLVHGFRTGAAAAFGVATVDLAYCAAATLTGTALTQTALTRTVEDHRAAFLLASGLVIVAIGVRQLRGGPPHHPPTRAMMPARAWQAFGRFAGLTAINPITLVYFVALAGAVTTTENRWAGSAVFVAAVGAASLGWQLLLVGVGSWCGATVNPRAARTIAVIASALIVTLGAVVVVGGLAAWG